MVESWSSEAAEVARDYRETLEELRMNSKPHINMLTMLAEENAAHAGVIADVIDAHIRRVEKPDMLLPSLYLIDSIIKNYKRGDEYKTAFQRRIVDLFVYVFQKSEEKTRQSMYKLRNTWNGFFPNSRLYRLDIKVHDIDPNWPISNPQSSGSSSAITSSSSSGDSEAAQHKRIHVNPKFVNSRPPPASSSSSSPGRTVQPPSKEPRKRKSENGESWASESDNKRRPSEGTGTAGHLAKAKSAMASEARRSPQQAAEAEQRGRSNLPLKKRGRDRAEASGSSEGEGQPEPSKPAAPKEPSPPPEPQPPPPQPPLKQRRPTPPMDEDLRQRQIPPPQPSRPPPRDPRRGPRGHVLGGPAVSVQPTSEPGSHAFAPRPLVPRAPPPVRNGPAVPPQPRPRHNGPSGSRSGGLLPAPDAHWTPGPSAHPPPPSFSTHQPSLPPPTPAPSLPPPTDAPKPPIPANNRIFVDGRAYEVQYIEDTPVIERNGLPHKIYFTGPPHDVVIDGIAHSLSFGERKTVSIDGQPHVIRFGAPSRELYMGNYAFRGAFGGPPIYATINGQRHEISLCGPPPEVKIEPEPAHELMRFLNANASGHLRGPVYDYSSSQLQPRTAAYTNFQGYTGMPPTAQQPLLPHPASAPSLPALAPSATPAPAVPAMDIGSLLNKLKESGVLAAAAAVAPAQPPATEKEREREPTPPIRCQFHFGEDEVVERRAKPPPNLKEFSIRVLRIRFESVIEALYSQEGQRCPNCGLRFQHMLKGTEDSRYKAHLDWHFRENSSRRKSRPWFYPVEDWATFSELEDPATRARSDVFEAAGAVQVPLGAASAPSPPSDLPPVIADAEGPHVLVFLLSSPHLRTYTMQECCVCKETFAKEWDDEDEYWLLKDAVRVNGQVYHPACVSDISALNSSTLDSSAGPEEPFLAEGGSVGSLPGLSVKTEALKREPEPFSNSASEPIVIGDPLDPVIPSASGNPVVSVSLRVGADVSALVKSEPPEAQHDQSSPSISPQEP